MVAISYQLKVQSSEFQSVREYVGPAAGFESFIKREMERAGAYGFSKVSSVDLTGRR